MENGDLMVFIYIYIYVWGLQEAALYVMQTRSVEEAMRIFTEVLGIVSSPSVVLSFLASFFFRLVVIVFLFSLQDGHERVNN